ncbi:hypothetical protein PG995_006425 [Apiospora arundinis]
MAMEPAKRDDEHDLDGDSEEWLTKETPLLYRALDPLLAPKDHISSFKPISSPLLSKKNVTTMIMVLRHLRDAKRRGWIERFEVDPAGTER